MFNPSMLQMTKKALFQRYNHYDERCNIKSNQVIRSGEDRYLVNFCFVIF
jgi:hypothetical protein